MYHQPGEFLWALAEASREEEETQPLPDPRMTISFFLNPDNNHQEPPSDHHLTCTRGRRTTTIATPSTFQQFVLELVRLEGIATSLPIDPRNERPWARHRISPLQRHVLERSYVTCRKPCPEDRHFLASLIGLSQQQVTTWYKMSLPSPVNS